MKEKVKCHATEIIRYALITQLHKNETMNWIISGWNWVQQRKGNRKIGFLLILFA